MCCGVEPVYGHHKYHEYDGRKNLPGLGYYCTVCHKSKSVWSNSISFAWYVWNESHTSKENHDPELHGLPGWRFARVLQIDERSMGRTYSYSVEHLLFYIDRTSKSLMENKEGQTCIIDESRCVDSLDVMNPANSQKVTLDLSGNNMGKNSHLWIGSSWCTDSTSPYIIDASICTARGQLQMKEALASIGFKV